MDLGTSYAQVECLHTYLIRIFSSLKKWLLISATMAAIMAAGSANPSYVLLIRRNVFLWRFLKNSGQNENKNIWMCTCVYACREMSSWLDPGRDHGDGVTLSLIIMEKSFTMTMEIPPCDEQDQIWPVLRNYYMEQSDLANLGQFRFTEVKLK
jgi:hypothetical protein